MSATSFALRRVFLFTFLAIGIVSTERWIIQSPAFGRTPTLFAGAVLFDLTVVVTGLFYAIVARPLRLPLSRTLFTAVLMLRIGLFLIPSSAGLTNTNGWTLLVVLAEGVVLLVAALRMRTIAQTYRQLRPTTDAETALHGSLAAVFGERAAGFIFGEIQIVRYVLLGWRLRSDVPTGARTLTTHRQSGQVALMIALLIVGLIELVAVHAAIARWSSAGAFWVTGVSAYGMLFFVADLVATLKRPSYVVANTLYLRLGVRWRATIAGTNVANVERISAAPPKAPDLLNGTLLTAPNVLLTLREPIVANGPYGLRRTVNRLALFLDEPEQLSAGVNSGA